MTVPPLAGWLRWIAERPPILIAAPEGFRRPDGTLDTEPATVVDGVVLGAHKAG